MMKNEPFSPTKRKPLLLKNKNEPNASWCLEMDPETEQQQKKAAGVSLSSWRQGSAWLRWRVFNTCIPFPPPPNSSSASDLPDTTRWQRPNNNETFFLLVTKQLWKHSGAKMPALRAPGSRAPEHQSLPQFRRSFRLWLSIPFWVTDTVLIRKMSCVPVTASPRCLGWLERAGGRGGWPGWSLKSKPKWEALLSFHRGRHSLLRPPDSSRESCKEAKAGAEWLRGISHASSTPPSALEKQCVSVSFLGARGMVGGGK